MAWKIQICTELPNGKWDQNVKLRTSDTFLANDIKARGEGGLTSPLPLIPSAPEAPAEGGCQWGAPCAAKEPLSSSRQRNEELLLQGVSPGDGLSTAFYWNK